MAHSPAQSDQDNHANQLNPNNDAFWESRGFEQRPDDWEDRVEDSQTPLTPPASSEKSSSA